MKLKVRNDNISFGTNILDVAIPKKLRERHPCGVDYIDDAFGGEGFTPSTITLFTGELLRSLKLLFWFLYITFIAFTFCHHNRLYAY